MSRTILQSLVSGTCNRSTDFGKYLCSLKFASVLGTFLRQISEANYEILMPRTQVVGWSRHRHRSRPQARWTMDDS